MLFITGVTAICILVTYLGLAYVRRRYIRSGFPGPWQLPVLGNLLQINPATMHLTMSDWAETFSDVFVISLLGTKILVISRPDLVREVFVSKGSQFAGRPRLHELDLMSQNGQNVGMSQPNPRWKMLRKLAHASLKMYDRGLKRIERVTMETVNELIYEIRVLEGEPFDPNTLLYLTTCNIISTFLTGRRFSKDSNYFKACVEFEDKTYDLLSKRARGCVMDLLPCFKGSRLDLLGRYGDRQRDAGEDLWRQIQKAKRETELEGFHDSLASMLEKAADEDGEITELHAKLLCLDITIAGGSSTTNTLYAWINILAHHPDIQQRLRAESRDVLNGRHVLLSDGEALAYHQASLLELLRYTSIAPFGLPHMCLEDSQLGGSEVKAGTAVYVNLFRVHHNDDIYPDPWRFRPERFLDTDGKLLLPDHRYRRHLMPFGAGPRVCFGKVLAMNRLFLIVTTLTQRFQISPVDKVSFDPRDYTFKSVLYPPEYHVSMRPWTE